MLKTFCLPFFIRKTINHRRDGFTLIELSIVLIIIGLIVGGVLVGNNLIRASEVRMMISDIEKFNTALNTFRQKYDCLPGDCINATTFFPLSSDCASTGGASNSITTTCNGNGNGVIDGLNSTVTAGKKEEYLVFQQLALAGLIRGVYAGSLYGHNLPSPFPTLLGTNSQADAWKQPIGNLSLVYDDGVLNNEIYQGWGPPSWSFVGHHVYEMANPASSTYGSGGSIGAVSAARANMIDSKLDDSFPVTGTVVTPNWTQHNGTRCINSTATAYLTSDVVNITAQNKPGCVLYIQAQF